MILMPSDPDVNLATTPYFTITPTDLVTQRQFAEFMKQVAALTKAHKN